MLSRGLLITWTISCTTAFALGMAFENFTGKRAAQKLNVTTNLSSSDAPLERNTVSLEDHIYMPSLDDHRQYSRQCNQVMLAKLDEYFGSNNQILAKLDRIESSITLVQSLREDEYIHTNANDSTGPALSGESLSILSVIGPLDDLTQTERLLLNDYLKSIDDVERAELFSAMIRQNIDRAINAQ